MEARSEHDKQPHANATKAWRDRIGAQLEANPAMLLQSATLQRQFKYHLLSEASTKHAFAVGFQSILQPNVGMFTLTTRDTPSTASTHEVKATRSSTVATEVAGSPVGEDIAASSAKAVHNSLVVAGPAQTKLPTSATAHLAIIPTAGARTADVGWDG